MRLPVVLLACCLAAPVWAQDDVDVDALAKTAQLAGDALIATACHLRPDSWAVIATPAITGELERMTERLAPSGGVTPADAPEFIFGLGIRGTNDGVVQWERYGKAACAAIQKDGSLARIDALVAGFKKPER